MLGLTRVVQAAEEARRKAVILRSEEESGDRPVISTYNNSNSNSNSNSNIYLGTRPQSEEEWRQPRVHTVGVTAW